MRTLKALTQARAQRKEKRRNVVESSKGRLLIVVLAFCAVGMQQLHAQQYPERPLRLVVGFPPGGGADTLGRIAAQQLGQGLMHQNVIVQNLAGAGSVVATNMVAQATPDGYTLLFTSIPFVINPHLYRSAKYDVNKDFLAVGHFASVPLMLATAVPVPVNSVKQLISYANANPGKVNYGTAGSGTSSHLAVELFKVMTGTNLVHVPYKGAGPVATALLSNEVQVVILNAVVLASHVAVGRLRGLAVTSPTRSAAFPQLPPIADDLPGYQIINWFGVIAPAGTPKAIIMQINKVMNLALETPALIKQLNAMGADTGGGTPEKFAAMIKADFPKWGKLVAVSGAKVD